MASRLRICLGLAAALGAVACEASAPAPSTYTVRDSAGVQIVESTAPAWAPDEAWTVSSEPILEIGVIDGPEEYQFTTIGGVWQEDAGTIVVADGRTREIRRYDSEGGFLSRWGGQGDGPGEFRGLISALPYRGDSILAMAGDKHTLFGPEGDLDARLPTTNTKSGCWAAERCP